MKNIIFTSLFAVLLIGCKSSRVGETDNVKVQFLDDYIMPQGLEVDGTTVGGLSGIDFHEGKTYIVSDHPGNPRLYKSEIDIEDQEIDTVRITEVIEIDQSHEVLRDAHLDLESIVYEPASEEFLLSSEGAIKSNKDPMVFKISKSGEFVEAYNLPKDLLAASAREPRNNGSLEGLAGSFDGKGVWTAMELPLKADGPKAKLYPTKSPVRITLFDKKTGQPVRQFPYMLSRVRKIPWLYFAVNGVTDLLEYAPDKFLVIERGFAAGHGSQGNTIRIYDVDASLATNTLERPNLKVNFYNPAKKELLYDFKWAKKFLSQEIIDNIEGITFGPELENGNRTLLLISDNNFNSIGKQLNQIVLLEFIPKK